MNSKQIAATVSVAVLVAAVALWPTAASAANADAAVPSYRARAAVCSRARDHWRDARRVTDALARMLEEAAEAALPADSWSGNGGDDAALPAGLAAATRAEAHALCDRVTAHERRSVALFARYSAVEKATSTGADAPGSSEELARRLVALGSDERASACHRLVDDFDFSARATAAASQRAGAEYGETWGPLDLACTGWMAPTEESLPQRSFEAFLCAEVRSGLAEAGFERAEALTRLRAALDANHTRPSGDRLHRTPRAIRAALMDAASAREGLGLLLFSHWPRAEGSYENPLPPEVRDAAIRPPAPPTPVALPSALDLHAVDLTAWRDWDADVSKADALVLAWCAPEAGETVERRRRAAPAR